MSGKITLITPPDIYENDDTGILFIHLADSDQDHVSSWLSKINLSNDVNFYIYNGEHDIPWLLWAMGHCKYKFIDLDYVNNITQSLSGYILGRQGFYYKTQEENLAAIYAYISNRRVLAVEQFLEHIFNDQKF
jgi:hypothetical protein